MTQMKIKFVRMNRKRNYISLP